MKIKSKIQEAWALTQANPGLKWFAFIPSLIGTIFGVFWITYQYVALRPLFSSEKLDYAALLQNLISFFQKNGSWTMPTIVFAIVFIIAYILLPTLFHSGLIALIARIRKGGDHGFFRGISLGLFPYLRMFEYKAALTVFNFMTVISISTLVLRTYGWDGFNFLFPVMIIVLIFGLIIGFFLSYAEYLIVLKKKQVFDAMMKSSGLVALNLPETALVMLLMILITIRILINLGLVILAPIAIILGTAALSAFALGTLGLIITIIIAIIILFFASYLSAIISVFTTAVWVVTFEMVYEESQAEIEGND